MKNLWLVILSNTQITSLSYLANALLEIIGLHATSVRYKVMPIVIIKIKLGHHWLSSVVARESPRSISVANFQPQLKPEI